MQECDTLYFGTLRPDGTPITATEWTAFVKDTIVPRFDGFTEWEANGYWKGSPERAHVVTIGRTRGDDTAIKQIMETYKKRFAQEAVLRVRSGCRISL